MSDDAEDKLEDTADENEPPRIRLLIRRRLPGRRLDKYLHGRFPRMSRTAIQRMIKQGVITVNARSSKPSYEMSGGDVIEMIIPPPEPTEIIPENIPLDIIYEDDHILAINKSAGIICHPAHGAQTGTIANAVSFHASELSSGTAPFRPGIVHRLDKNTTGVMLIAKTDEAHWRLGMQFEQRTLQKTYLAVVEGELELDQDVINAPIGVHPIVRVKFAVLVSKRAIDITKEAITRYEAVERFRDYTLVKLSPKTGRTHQLRVHMSYIKHPVVGDGIYGGKPVSVHDLTGSGDTRPIFAHQALHAWRIKFMHPIKQEPLEIEAPFQGAFKELVNTLRSARSV